MKRQPAMLELVEEYLRTRRSLGYELRVEGEELIRFARFADQLGYRGPLTTTLALSWATSSRKASRLAWARRLEVVRSFARFRFMLDPATEIPPPGLLGPAHRRVTPHIYSEQEITALMEATAQLLPASGLRAITIRYLIGLLATTGLRPSEAVNLRHADVNLTDGVITVRETKFHKSRMIPLHPSTTAALSDYSALRDHHAPLASGDAFFLLDGGIALTYSKAAYAFKRLRQILGWTTRHNGRLPRLYDLRHYFVCRRLLDWYAKGMAIDQVIPFLSTYLGHVKVSDTYWYITGVPELMAIAAERFEHFGDELHQEASYGTPQ